MSDKTDRDLLCETHDAVVRLACRFDSVARQVERHERQLFGNGRWGLVACTRALLGFMAFTALVAGGVAVAAIAKCFGG